MPWDDFLLREATVYLHPTHAMAWNSLHHHQAPTKSLHLDNLPTGVTGKCEDILGGGLSALAGAPAKGRRGGSGQRGKGRGIRAFKHQQKGKHHELDVFLWV